MVALPSYVAGAHDAEAINYLAAVVSGSLVGLDMRDFHGQDWVSMGANFFNADEGVYVNSLRGQTGNSFWYDILPNIFAYPIERPVSGGRRTKRTDDYGRRGMARRVRALVDSRANPALPNFDHTGFRLSTMQPAELGWIEPEAAAGIAWMEYMAWVRSQDPRFLKPQTWRFAHWRSGRPITARSTKCCCRTARSLPHA